MASYFPLIVNSGSGTIDELPSGDDLNLQGSNIANATTVTAGNIVTSGGTADLSNSANVTLGAVGNLHISGGSSGQFLRTDGSGNLSWAAGGAQSNISNGTSNVAIATSGGNVTTSVNGNANIIVATGTGANINGYANVSGNVTAGNLKVTGNVTSNLLPDANITYDLGSSTQRWKDLWLSNSTIYLGNASITANATAIVLNNPQGGSTVLAGASGSDTINITGNLTSGNANLGNSATANYFIGALYGTANLATYATTANAVAGANVSGAVGLATYATTANAVAGANVSGTVASATSAASANAVAGANVSGAVSYATTANSVAGANVSGQVGNATVAGTVYTNAQPNITSVGTLTSLTVNGTITANNANITGNIVPTSNNTFSLGSATSYWKDAFIGPGSLYINGVKVLEESSNAIVISADLNQTVRVTSTGSGDVQLQTTGSGVIAVKGPLQIQAGNYITSSNGGPVGFSNPINTDTISSLSANTNLTISANGTGNIQLNDDVTITGNLTLNGGGGNLSVTSLSVEDNIIDVSAETTGVPVNNAGIRVIRGDEPSVQNRWNETTETWQITNDGSTYLNVVGANTTTGNANVGNIGATAGIFTTVAGALTTASQPNITSVGTLSTLNVSGNANAGNIGITNLVASGTGSFGANVNMNSNWLTNVGYPSANTDAATKQYVDTMISSGISYHQPVDVATTTTLQVATGGTTSYNSPNGAANGIGAYISTTGTFLNIDGANVQTVGTRILVKNESNAAWNGVYTYANSTAIVRSQDTDEYGPDSTEQLSVNDYFFVQGGIVNEGSSYILSAPAGTITFGTSNIVFSTFSSSQVYDAGTGLTLTGTTFSVNASQTQITAIGTLATLNVSGNANVGNVNGTNGVFTNVSGNGSALTSITGANVTGAVSYATTANAVAGGNVSGQVSYAATANSVAGANVSGEVSFAATANAVAGGNVSGAVSYATTANAVAGANVSGAVNLATYATTANSVALANVSGAGNLASVNKDGNASNILYGNGVFASAPVTYGNSNVVTLLGSFGSNTITTTGNVSVGNIIGNGQALSGLAGSNVVGAVGLATYASTANAVAGANVSGQVSYAATANAVAGGNVSGAVSYATTANAVAGANVSGTVANATYATSAGSATSATTAGTVTTAAQPNITSTGTLTSLAVTGNITGGNVYANSGTMLAGNIAANDTAIQYSAKIYANGSIASRNGGVDGTYADAFVAGYTSNYTEKNIIQTSVSSSGTGSGFRFKASDGGGASTTTTVLDLTRTLATCYTNLTVTGNISGGNLSTSGTMSAGTVTETSSLALKENFRPIENPLEKVMQLLGQIYDRKDGSSKDEAGLVAEDVYKVIPNLVKTDSNGNPESVFYTRLTVYLLESIKVLSDEITQLKSRK